MMCFAKNVKKVFSIVLCLCMLMQLLPVHVHAETGGAEGEGYEESTGGSSRRYQVYNAAGLLAWNEAARVDPTLGLMLMDDITLPEGTNWTPVGDDSNFYTGTVDGNGYKITGLSVDNTEFEADGKEIVKQYQGFIGYLGSDGVVKNLTFENASVAGGMNTAIVVGTNAGTIENCHVVSGSVISKGSSQAGGIAGYNTGTVENCTNAAEIKGDNLEGAIGGIVGRNNATIVGCTNTGAVSADAATGVGGIAGENNSGIVSLSLIIGCINKGAVRGNERVGGVIGESSGNIAACGNRGDVTAIGTLSKDPVSVGGIVGYADGGTIYSSWTVDTTELGENGIAATEKDGIGRAGDTMIQFCFATAEDADISELNQGVIIDGIENPYEWANGDDGYPKLVCAGEHTRPEASQYKNNGDTHSFTCIACRETITEEHTENEYAPGYCSVCGEMIMETFPVSLMVKFFDSETNKEIETAVTITAFLSDPNGEELEPHPNNKGYEAYKLATGEYNVQERNHIEGYLRYNQVDLILSSEGVFSLKEPAAASYAELVRDADGKYCLNIKLQPCTHKGENDQWLDNDNDHICDTCYAKIFERCKEATPEVSDHHCDCGAIITERCTDTEDNNHICDVCGSDMTLLHKDDNNDHYCDNEACFVHLTDKCYDKEDEDHLCDVCYRVMCNGTYEDPDNCAECGKCIHFPNWDIEITCDDEAQTHTFTCQICEEQVTERHTPHLWNNIGYSAEGHGRGCHVCHWLMPDATLSPHVYTTAAGMPHYNADDTHHWPTCVVCFYEENNNKKAHEFDPVTKTCECGKAMYNVGVTMNNGEEVGYDTLSAAIAAVADATAENNATVKLYRKIDLTEPLNITSGVFTLDLNDKTISGGSETLFISDSSKVTIQDNSTSKNGSIKGGTAVRVGTGELVVESGAVIGEYNGIFLQGNGSVTIKGGKISGDTGVFNYYGGGTLCIEGGTINAGVTGIYVNDNQATITGGSISGNTQDLYAEFGATFGFGYNEETGMGATFPGGIEVYGATLENILVDGAAYWQDGKQVTLTDDQTEITGGDVTVMAACAHESENKSYTYIDGNVHSVTCEDCGTALPDEPHSYDAEGKCACSNGEALVAAKVTMGEGAPTYYDTLEEAIEEVKTANVNDNAVVTLLKDVESSGRLKINSGEFTLDLNNHTITITTSIMEIKGDSNTLPFVTIKDSGVNGAITADGSCCIFVSYALLVVEDGTLSHEDATCIYSSDSQVKITGGTMIGGTGMVVDNSTVAITGGSISGEFEDILRNDDNSTITLMLAEGKTEGATFPDGIKVNGTTLEELLYTGAAYWKKVDNKLVQVTPSADQTAITDGDVVIKAAHVHAPDEDGCTVNENGTHSFTCDCGETITEPHKLAYAVASNVINAYCTVGCGAEGTATLNGVQETYCGEPIVAAVSYVNWPGENLTVTYKQEGTPLSVAPADVGEYSTHISVGSVAAQSKLTILPKNINTSTIKVSKKTYNGYVQPPEVSVQMDGELLESGMDYTVKTSGQVFKNADTYQIEIIGTGNYEGNVPTNYVIEKMPLYVTAKKHSIFYGDAPANDSVEYRGFVMGEDESILDGELTYSYNYEQYGDVGEYTITPAGLTSENYEIIFEPGVLLVAKNAANNIVVNLAQDEFVYKGSEIRPAVTSVVVSGRTLINGTDYTVDYLKNVNAGTAEVSVILKGNYEGGTVEYFTIKPKVVTNPTFDGLEEWYLHTGSAIEPEFKLKDGETEISASEYSVAYSNNTDAGIATITITDKDGGNYTVSGTKTFEIKVHEHDWTYAASGSTITATCEGTIGTCPVENGTVTITLHAPENLTYDGSAKTVTVTQNPAGVLTGIPAVTYDGDCTSAGTHTASLTYGGKTATLRFTIEKASLAEVEITVAGGNAYTGSAVEPTVTVTLDGKTLSKDTDYTVTYANNTHAGTATVTITGVGNYSSTVSESFTIAKAAAPEIQWPTASAITFGQLLSESTLSSEDANGTFAWQDGAIVPTMNNNGYVVVYTPKDTNNYDYSGVVLTKTIPVTVNKAAASVIVAPTPKDLTYTGEARNLISGGEVDGGTMQYSLDQSNWSTSIPQGTAADTYAVYYKVVGDKNHEDIEWNTAMTVPVIITPKTLTIADATIENVQFKEDGSYTLTVTDVTLNGVVQGESLVMGTDYTAVAEWTGENQLGEQTAEVSVSMVNANYCVQTPCVTTVEIFCDHDFAAGEYVWSEDNLTCTVTGTCEKGCGTTEQATAVVTSEETKAPTCLDKGETTYTATFTEPWAKTQTRTVADTSALDHDWKDTAYNWSADGKSCIATRACGNDAAHNVTAEAKITSETTKVPTTSSMGETTYTATFTETWAETQTLTLVDIPELNQVNVSQPEGGDVTVDNSTPATGDEVTITIEPETGKEVDEVTVTFRGSEEEVPVTDNGDGTYTFEQPVGDVEINVTMKDVVYEEPEEPAVEGGEAEVEVKGADEVLNYGDKITVTVKPEAGKEVENVTVTIKGTETEVPVTENDDGTYSYNQPDGEVEINVTMKEIEYENEIPEVSGGKVETDTDNPTMDDEVTITVTPDGGKEVADVIVMDEDGNKVEVTKNPDGTYSYIQPIGKVTINVTFRNKYYPSYPDYDEEKPAEAEDHFRVLCRKLNVRSDAGTQYRKIGSLSRGDCVEGELLDNGWVMITLEDGTVGYVSGLYVEDCEDHDAELPETATVICRKLNVRSGAGTQYRRVGQIGRGEVVSIVDSCNGWYEIVYEDDYSWICAKYVA